MEQEHGLREPSELEEDLETRDCFFGAVDNGVQFSEPPTYWLLQGIYPGTFELYCVRDPVDNPEFTWHPRPYNSGKKSRGKAKQRPQPARDPEKEREEKEREKKEKYERWLKESREKEREKKEDFERWVKESRPLTWILQKLDSEVDSDRLFCWKDGGMFVRKWREGSSSASLLPGQEEADPKSTVLFVKPSEERGNKAVLFTSVVIPNMSQYNGVFWVKRFCMQINLEEDTYVKHIEDNVGTQWHKHEGAEQLQGTAAMDLLRKQLLYRKLQAEKGYHFVDADNMRPYDNPIHYQSVCRTLVQGRLRRQFFMAKGWMQPHFDALYVEKERNQGSEYWLGVKYTGRISSVESGTENLWIRDPRGQAVTAHNAKDHRNPKHLLYFFHLEAGGAMWLYVPCEADLQEAGTLWYKCRCFDISHRVKGHAGASVQGPPSQKDVSPAPVYFQFWHRKARPEGLEGVTTYSELMAKMRDLAKAGKIKYQ